MQIFKTITLILNVLVLLLFLFLLFDNGLPGRFEEAAAITVIFLTSVCTLVFICLSIFSTSFDSEMQKMKCELKKLEIQLRQAEIKEKLEKMKS